LNDAWKNLRLKGGMRAGKQEGAVAGAAFSMTQHRRPCQDLRHSGARHALAPTPPAAKTSGFDGEVI
jgi:hypothetical protein